MFTEEALSRFRNPKNTGNLMDFNEGGKAGDPSCSDLVHLKVRFIEGKVKSANYKNK